MRNNKGQLGNLQGIVVTLVVVGALLAAVFILFDGFKNQLNENTVTVTNESGAFINESGYTVGAASDPGFNSLEITEARNATSGSVIAASEYEIRSDDTVFNATATEYSDVNLDYTYKKGEGAYEAVDETSSAMETLPELLGVVILIAVVGIIMFVLFRVFPGSARGA